jgi:hypothetical protein
VVPAALTNTTCVPPDNVVLLATPASYCVAPLSTVVVPALP